MVIFREEWSESRKRSLLKAISWRILGTLTTFGATFSITKNLDVATVVVVTEFFLKILLFYIHERCWLNLERFKFNFLGNKNE